VFVPFSDGQPNGMAQDVATGFPDSDNHARGRPVGPVVDKSGRSPDRRRCRQTLSDA
jgi:hypothetical protein